MDGTWTRPPAIAGTFYPADPDALHAEISGYLRHAHVTAANASPKALIAPHAGTIYSGPVAATAYASLAARAADIRRVVLLGPAHRVWLNGMATSSASAFATPLGSVALDRPTIDALLETKHIVVHDEAHRREHSLEVHLPFLQSVLSDFVLVPIVVGKVNAEAVAALLDAVWGGDETLVVVSTDLSHFHAYEKACVIDGETNAMIEALDGSRLDGERACGHYPVRGLLHHAKAHGLTVTNIDLRNSGDTAGSRREVVGYGSYVVA